MYVWRRKTRKYTFETDIYKSTSMARMQMTGRDQEVEGGPKVPRSACNFTPFISKSCQMWEHFFQLLFPKDSESLKILDIQLWEVGAKICLKNTS